MIPYFKLTTIPLGPVDIQVWGLMVALGMMAGLYLGRRLAVKGGLDGEVMVDVAVWTLIPALVFGRLGHVVFYNLAAALQDPLSVFRVWDGGMSSFGGYLGAAIGALVFIRRKKIKFRPYAEIAAFVLPLGYGIGRLGCFFIHDHPGVLCNCFFAVAFPDGARLDHGLLLSMFGLLLFAVFLFLKKRGRYPGADRWRYLPLLLISYGALRLVLDFFRAWDLPHADARFLYLTPSQYGAFILIALGVWLLRRRSSTAESLPVTEPES